MSAKIDYKQMGLLSLYGLSLIWSPMFGTSEAVAFPSLASLPDQILLSRFFNLLAYGIAMAFMALAGERCRQRSMGTNRATTITAAAVGAFGMLSGSLVGLGMLPIPWLYIGALSRGLFYGILTISWLEVLIHLDSNLIGAAVSSALILYAIAEGAVLLFSTGAPQFIPAAFLTICPVISSIGCLLASRRIANEGPVSQESDKAPLRTVCLFCVANFIFGAMISTLLWYYARFDTLESSLIFLVAAVAFFAVFAYIPERAGVGAVQRGFSMLFAIVIAAIVLLAHPPQDAVASIVSPSVVFLILYTVVIFMDTQARVRKPYWRFPGICQVFAALGMIGGSAVSQSMFRDSSAADSRLLLLAVLCVLFIACTFSPNSRTRQRPWGFSSLIPAEAPKERMRRRCNELAEECSLTNRELEVLKQLAEGKSKDEIAEALTISPATSKTHIRNIYSKLNVHSQHELDIRLDL
ncbi:response regulator transcription factor [Curtanaerobium respiraculi]|uniref:response regulator transcription factor n=1 Tax=Curtanaerobium respiraculi TaxID=2949669 RepID=UPI0024B3B1EE|nr:helix-turn-helix transcriptional regulator [Curtanaerobium respiraculi]